MELSDMCCYYDIAEENECFLYKRQTDFRHYLRKLQTPPSLPLVQNSCDIERGLAEVESCFERRKGRWGSSGFSRSCSVVLTFLLPAAYAALMCSLQFQLYRYLQFPVNNRLLASKLQHFGQFHWFFGIGTTLATIPIACSYCSAYRKLRDEIIMLCKHIAKECSDDFRINLKEKLEEAFINFIKRSKIYFFLSPDLSSLELRKIHRKMMFGFYEYANRIEFPAGHASALKSEVFRKSAVSQCHIIMYILGVPLTLLILANFLIIYYAASFPHIIEQQLFYELDYRSDFTVSLIALIQNEGLKLILAGTIIQTSAGVYLLFVSSGPAVHTLLRQLYAPIRLGVAGYCNRLMSKIWEELIIDGIVPFILEIRPTNVLQEESLKKGFQELLGGKYLSSEESEGDGKCFSKEREMKETHCYKAPHCQYEALHIATHPGQQGGRSHTRGKYEEAYNSTHKTGGNRINEQAKNWSSKFQEAPNQHTHEEAEASQNFPIEDDLMMTQQAPLNESDQELHSMVKTVPLSSFSSGNSSGRENNGRTHTHHDDEIDEQLKASIARQNSREEALSFNKDSKSSVESFFLRTHSSVMD